MIARDRICAAPGDRVSLPPRLRMTLALPLRQASAIPIIGRAGCRTNRHPALTPTNLLAKPPWVWPEVHALQEQSPRHTPGTPVLVLPENRVKSLFRSLPLQPSDESQPRVDSQVNPRNGRGYGASIARWVPQSPPSLNHWSDGCYEFRLRHQNDTCRKKTREMPGLPCQSATRLSSLETLRRPTRCSQPSLASRNSSLPVAPGLPLDPHPRFARPR